MILLTSWITSCGLELLVVDGGDEEEAQAETASAVAVTVGGDLETFEDADEVRAGHTFARYGAVSGLVGCGQPILFAAFFSGCSSSRASSEVFSFPNGGAFVFLGRSMGVSVASIKTMSKARWLAATALRPGKRKALLLASLVFAPF